MALVVETGDGIDGANSYVTLDELRTYASSRGVTLSTDDNTVEIDSTKAMDYLETFRSKFQGVKTDSDNPLQFPRKSVYIDNVLVDDDHIPIELKNAQCQLVVEIHNGIDLQPSVKGGDRRVVIERRVEKAVTRKFSDKSFKSVLPDLKKFEKIIQPLLKRSGFGFVNQRV